MKLPFVLTLLLAPVAGASVVALPQISTSWSSTQTPPVLSHVTGQTVIPVNLDDRTGLTPGMPILLTLTPAAQFVWACGFCVGAGQVDMTFVTSLQLVIGGDSVTVAPSIHQNFPSKGELCPGGFARGPEMPSFTLTVPWSADLTQARFVISQDSTITGNQTWFRDSAVSLALADSAPPGSALSLTLTSVPEPGAAVLFCLGTLVSLGRRWPSL